jgi:hypothetical protein
LIKSLTDHRPVNRSSIRFACSVVLVAAVVLCGCSTVSQEQSADAILRGKSLDDAEKLLVSAEQLHDNNTGVVYRLRAAEIAWTDLARHSSSVKRITALPLGEQRAVHLLNEATAEVAPLLVTGGSSPGATQTYSFAGCSYRLTPAPVNSRGEYKPSDFEGVTPADKVPRKLCREWHTEDGVGAPLAPEWRIPADERQKRFTPLRGYSEPITAVLQLGPAAKAKTGRIVRIAYLDPSDVSHARIAQTEYPLAADFTAPIVARYSGIKESSIALGGLLGNPDVRDARLGMTEPYDPHRIPVLFVHGLNSHPLMWRDVINDLRFDPELRGKYQFWVFYYPTGWPPAYSALRLREELAALDKVYGRQHGMVLVGHSMGGIIARMQVISPGRAIWNAQGRARADELYETLPPTHLLKRALLFSANPDIGREIYICVPHRGSKMADWAVTSFFTKFIRLPANIMSAATDVRGVITERRQLSSVHALSPNNPLYAAIDHIPIQVPYHSIIGDRGRGDTPNSSDGVVQYWSSHLDGARSELIVPGPHGSYSLPQTIDELKRILKLHLASRARAESDSAPITIAEQ